MQLLLSKGNYTPPVVGNSQNFFKTKLSQPLVTFDNNADVSFFVESGKYSIFITKVAQVI
jgi:hypothetical protein